MIDDLFDRFRSNDSNENDTETLDMSIPDMSDDAKRDAAYQRRYRCVHCNIPNFREDLYLIEEDGNAIPACESCLQASGDSENITEDRCIPSALTGRLSYRIGHIETVENLRHRQHGDVVVKEIDHDGNAHMGEYPRRMVESKYSNPQDNVWLGYYQKGNRIRELGMDYDDLFVHVYIQGTTGGGKTTTGYNILNQFAWSGFGFACIDPHGDLVEDLLQSIPPHRRGDVVVFDPVGDDDRQASLNLFEIEKEPDDPGYHEAVDAAVSDVRSGMRRGGDWGQRMGPINDNLARGMIMHPDTYTFLDYRDMLIHQDKRVEFARKMDEQGFHFADYTQQIAEMGEMELSPLIRRLEGWTSSKITRDLISPRESTISFEETIDKNKILLVNTNIPDPDIKKMVSSAIIRRLARAAKGQPKGERTPFLMLADEVDDIINREMNLDDLLSNMRKYKFGMILMTQYLNKIDDRNVEQAIRKLCNTTLTFRDPDGKLAEKSTSPSSDLDNYRALLKMRIDGQTKGPYKMAGFAPYPARRTPDEARKWIRKPALERCGVPKGDHEASDDTTSKDQETILKAIHDSALIDGDESRGVRLDDAMPRLLDRIRDEDMHPAKIEALIAEIPAGENGKIKRYEDSNGDIRLQATPKGTKHIWQTGNGIQSGGIRHSQLLMDAYQPLTELGVEINIPDGSGRGPDASINPDPNTDTHPVIEFITESSESVIEAESATGKAMPGKTCMNLAQAANDGPHCILLARPDTATKVHRTLTDPPFVRAQTIDRENRLYHVRYLRIDGETMLRPDNKSETVWIPEPDEPGFILRDTEGTEHHRFGNARAVFEDAGGYPNTIPTGSDVPDGWTRVRAPFIPEREFEEIPDEDDWTIVSVPHDAESADDLHVVVDDQSSIALTELHEWDEKHKKNEIADSIRDILDE